MSVATKNPFAILDAEDSSRPSTPAAPSSKAAPQAPVASTRGTQKTRGPASRGGKYYPRGGRSGPRDSNQPPAEEPVTENQRKSEGRGRGRGNRGGPTRGGRRPFDRHSQTGKTDSDKKVHQGWGGDEGTTELKAEEAAVSDAAAEATPETPADDAEPAAADAQPEARPRREREPEEEDNTLTLDQYLAKQKETELALPKIEATRQANEGADGDLWKDAVAITKNEDEESYFIGKTKSAPKARTKKEEKVFIEIDGRFDRPERGGRGRGRGAGDRGRGTGRGRGGPRGGPRQNGTPGNLNVDDQTAFPSLA
ncbi:hypothetical protein D9756_003797 [Leucocoprinus leucothites]|uniref:Hyaluronan/mRNA-binding protein domain-containing protein n=1 Tax=Leucocoprinus leucothites TaxID=201217 RepID=A0A8H5DBV4_9AGAR|nr:hypothetical protein D9756_003797 [Leucoagaricus leucothites]